MEHKRIIKIQNFYLKNNRRRSRTKWEFGIGYEGHNHVSLCNGHLEEIIHLNLIQPICRSIIQLNKDRIATGGGTYIQIWDTNKKQMESYIRGKSIVRCICNIPPNYICNSHYSPGISIYNMNTEKKREILVDKKAVNCMIYKREQLIAGTWDEIYLIDPSNFSIKQRIEEKAYLKCLSLYNSTHLLSGSMRLYNLEGNVELINKPSEGINPDSYYGMTVLANGLVAYGGSKGILGIWDLGVGGVIDSFLHGRCAITAIIQIGREWVLTANEDSCLRFLNISNRVDILLTDHLSSIHVLIRNGMYIQ